MNTFHKSMMANKFVEHIENHIKQLVEDGNLPKGSEACCKICGKTITEIWEELVKKEGSKVVKE